LRVEAPLRYAFVELEISTEELYFSFMKPLINKHCYGSTKYVTLMVTCRFSGGERELRSHLILYDTLNVKKQALYKYET
jgi:hypothetical protein